MKVTKFNYALDNALIDKLNIMIDRCVLKSPKRDALLNIEGAEGEGKTSLSVAIAYYVSDKTNRPFNHKHIFFDINKMIKFLQDTEGQIAIWDEPALQALSGDALRSIVKDLKRMLMMCRNRRHFIIINMTYFTEFGSYIVWERPLGMIHVYSRKEVEAGRFVYIRKKCLEKLFLDWRSKKQRNYKKYGSKRCRGTFPDVLNPDYRFNVLKEFSFKDYEKEKNEAINSIGVEQKPKKITEKEVKIKLLNQMIENNKRLNKPLEKKEIQELLGISKTHFYRLLGDAPESNALLVPNI